MHAIARVSYPKWEKYILLLLFFLNTNAYNLYDKNSEKSLQEYPQ